MNGLIAVLIVGAILGGVAKISGINAVLVRIYNDRRDVAKRR